MEQQSNNQQVMADPNSAQYLQTRGLPMGEFGLFLLALEPSQGLELRLNALYLEQVFAYVIYK